MRKNGTSPGHRALTTEVLTLDSMIGLTHSAVYNARNPEMSAPSRAHWSCFLLFLMTQLVLASDWKQPEAQLAQKIAAAIGPGVVALKVTNRSSLSAAEVEEIHREIVTLLATSGVRIWEPNQAASTIRITLSESLQNYIWVAEIHQGTIDPVILMVSEPRPDSALRPQNTAPLTIRAIPLIAQPDRILDAAVIEGNPRRMLVLATDTITPYEFKDGHWNAGPALAITRSHPFPRDLRGRIVLRKDHLFDAYLPGLVCRSTNSSPLALNCAHSDDPWPLQTERFGVSGFFAPARNFFTGALVPGIGRQRSAPAFYSAAAVSKDRYTLWILAGVDGPLHLLDGISQQVETKVHWGSSIAGVHASCRTGGQVLASSTEAGADSIQAFEFPDRAPLPVSQKLDLNGTVTELWPSSDGESATVIFRNSATGNYEAMLLNLTCGQ